MHIDTYRLQQIKQHIWATFGHIAAVHFYKRRKFHPFLCLRVNLLHFVQKVKFLGLIFDSHTKQFKMKATKAQYFAGETAQHFCGFTECLFICNSAVLARCWSQFTMKLLESVQGSQSSPVESLHAESGEPPLSLHREYTNRVNQSI